MDNIEIINLLTGILNLYNSAVSVASDNPDDKWLPYLPGGPLDPFRDGRSIGPGPLNPFGPGGPYALPDNYGPEGPPGRFGPCCPKPPGSLDPGPSYRDPYYGDYDPESPEDPYATTLKIVRVILSECAETSAFSRCALTIRSVCVWFGF